MSEPSQGPGPGDPGGAWEASSRQSGSGGAPVLAVDGFEGPLPWLLELARTRRIDLARLPIAELVAAFDEALTAALATADVPAAALGRWGDWLVMAAELTLLRSRLLLPDDPAGAHDAPNAAEALRVRLLRRAGVAAAADWLERQQQLGREVFGRGQGDTDEVAVAGRVGDITGLLRACLLAIRLPPEADTRFAVPGPPFWSVADAAARIRALLPVVGEGGAPLGAFLPDVPGEEPDRELRCRVAVAGTLLAGLEMVREGSIAVEQDAAWAELQIGPASAKEPVDFAPAA